MKHKTNCLKGKEEKIMPKTKNSRSIFKASPTTLLPKCREERKISHLALKIGRGKSGKEFPNFIADTFLQFFP
jgi:hypothetical protein